MTTDVERLILSMEANMKKFEREFARASGLADRNMRQIERRVEQSESKVAAAMGRVGGAVRAGIAGALAGVSLSALTSLSDSYIKVQNSLKVTGLEGEKLTGIYKELFDLAQKQGIPLESLADLYSKTATNQKELNASSADVITFTNAVGTALRAGGVGAVQADQALMQLGQALASGKVQWEEMASVVDSAPTIMQAAAAGILQADGSVGKLTGLIKEGKVSSEALFRGIIAGLPAVQALADKTEETSSQGVARLKNAMIDLVGQLLKSSGASGMATSALDNVAKSIKNVTDQIPGAIEALEGYFEKLKKTPYFQSLVKSIADTEGGSTPRAAAAPGSDPGNMFDEAARSDRNASAGSLKGMEGALQRVAAGKKAVETAAAKPIDLDKFKVPGDKKGGGGGKSENEYQREIKNIRERTAALENEATTVGRSEGEIAKSEAAFKLLAAAKEANVALTPQLLADIEATASAMGTATQKLHEAEEAYRAFEAKSQQLGHTLSDAFKDAILNGEKLTDLMGKLLKSIAARGIDSIFDTLFGKGGVGGSFLSSVLGGGGDSPTGGVRLFDDGGYTGPGGKHQPAGVVHRGEYVMDAATTRRIGRRNLDAIRRGRGYAAGGFVGGAPLAPMSPPAVARGSALAPRIDARRSYAIDARGAQIGAAEQIVAALQAYDASLSRTFGQRLAAWKEDN